MVGKRKTVEPEEKGSDREPSVFYTSLLPADGDYDFFPHMDAKSQGADNQFLQQLKSGTYQPFMQMNEYKAKIEKRSRLIKGARPMGNEFSASKKDKWKIYSAAEMVPLREMQTTIQNRLRILGEAYKNSNIPMLPRYYHNNYQYFDHVLLSDSYINSFGGTVIDAYADFIMPKGIKPVLKIRDLKKYATKDKQMEAIKKNQDIIETLEAIDRWYSDNGPTARNSFMEIPLQQKFKTALTLALTFGRDALVYENWKHIDPVEVNGKEYPGLPNVIKPMQPIDIGMVEIDYASWNLGGFYVYNTRNYIPSAEALYLVNQYLSPMIGGMYYGYTKLSRALDMIRLLRRIFAVNYQQFIRNGAMGMGVWKFDSTGYDDVTRQKIRTALKNTWKSGEIGVVDYANIKDLEFVPMNINVKISELQQLEAHLFTVISGVMGMPQSLIFDEGMATRATFVGRIVSFLNHQIPAPRSIFGAQFANQHYMRIYRTVYEDDERLNDFYIDVEFEEQDLETKTEKVNRLLLETQLNPMTDQYIGDELNEPDYLNNIDKKKRAEMMNMGGGMGGPQNLKTRGQNFTVEDNKTGQNVQVSES